MNAPQHSRWNTVATVFWVAVAIMAFVTTFVLLAGAFANVNSG